MESFLIFRRKLLGLAPGKKIHLTIVRNGEEKEITSTLVRRAMNAPASPLTTGE
jgi:S1-C subfamily serine protease